MLSHAWEHYNKPAVLVVHDELHLPFGECKVRMRKIRKDKKEKNEHKGMLSIVTKLPSVWCFEIGVGPSSGPSVPSSHRAAYMRSKFDVREQERMPELLHNAGEVLRAYVHGGIDSAKRASSGNLVS